MPESLQSQFWGLGQNVFDYLPNLIAGLLLVILGWAVGWFIKRVVIQIALLLKLERFLTSFRWGEDFAKADIRYGFYNLLGNVAFFIVFLIFLDNAFGAWKLTVLSELVARGIFFLPSMVLSLIIFGGGWLISGWAARSVRRTFHREGITHSGLIARAVKAVLLVLFAAMALVELDIAREIVIIGFATIIITLGAMAVTLTVLGGKDFLKRLQQPGDDK
jgi:hypothetical protein